MDEKKRQHLEAQLSAYLDNELNDRERAEVEAFLSEYAEARELLAELQATVELVRNLPRAKASDQLMDGLRGRLERDALLGVENFEKPAAAGSISSGWRWMGAAAVIALTLVTAYMMGPFSKRSAPEGPQFAFRDAKPDKTATDSLSDYDRSEMSDKSQLTIGKRKLDEPSTEPPMPAAPVKESITGGKNVFLLACGGPRATTVEQCFDNAHSRERAFQTIRLTAASNNWQIQMADQSPAEMEAGTATLASMKTIEVELVLPEGRDVNEAVKELSQQVPETKVLPDESATTQPAVAEEPPSTSPSLQANQPVAVGLQSQPAIAKMNADCSNLIRLKVCNAGPATTAPASQIE